MWSIFPLSKKIIANICMLILHPSFKICPGLIGKKNTVQCTNYAVLETCPNPIHLLRQYLSTLMRQCQIRVRFESRGMQFFNVLGKWLSMTKYFPIIVLWCSERGFYKKVTWSPVLGILPMPQITWQCMCVYWGKLILEKILKVANIDIGFSVCYINKEK